MSTTISTMQPTTQGSNWRNCSLTIMSAISIHHLEPLRLLSSLPPEPPALLDPDLPDLHTKNLPTRAPSTVDPIVWASGATGERLDTARLLVAGHRTRRHCLRHYHYRPLRHNLRLRLHPPLSFLDGHPPRRPSLSVTRHLALGSSRQLLRPTKNRCHGGLLLMVVGRFCSCVHNRARCDLWMELTRSVGIVPLTSKNKPTFFYTYGVAR